MNTGRALVGIGLLAIGLLILLEQVGVLDAGEVIADWWPVLFVVQALLELIARPARPIGAAVFAVLGLGLLGMTTGVVDDAVMAVAWPLGIIALGIWILFRRPVPSSEAGDRVDATVIFSGRKIVNTSPRFRGGSTTAIFGGIALDLTGARIDEVADLEAVALFGGVDLKVPLGWRIQLDGPAIFGGNENKVPPPPADADAPTLRVRATAIFGSVEVGLGTTTPVTAAR